MAGAAWANFLQLHAVTDSLLARCSPRASPARQIKFADLSPCKKKLQLELQSEKEQCTIVLLRNATTGPAARMERIVKVAEAAGDLQNMGDLFACSPTDDIPDIVRLSLKSPNEPASTLHAGTPRGFSLPAAPKVVVSALPSDL